jgi:hypothetical protein
MITVSLLLNLAVLVPVCAGLIADARWTHAAYAGVTPARSILLAVYVAIGVASALLLIRPSVPGVATLLLVQVVYKLLTPITVGTLANPVVSTNLAVAAVHACTLALIWRTRG